ncbi:MAG: AAA family ATPase [Prevotella sp.]|nr:AAA family ATPase [Prevotella sp.]
MVYITNVILQKVRNIPRLEIPLDDQVKKHLILTGPNGSGKTTVIKEISGYLEGLSSIAAYYDSAKQESKVTEYEDIFIAPKAKTYKNVIARKEQELRDNSAAILNIREIESLYPMLLRNEFVVCTFNAHRTAQFIEPNGPTKISRPKSTKEGIGKYFVQLLVNLRSRRSFANDDGDTDTVEKIRIWFDNFEQALTTLLGHSDFELQFDTKKFTFTIKEKDKKPYHFSQLSDGYSALLSIVSEIMLRMSLEEPLDLYDKQGFILIDEVENHLHVELQKKVLPFLTTLFPDIQFIVTTHSPFVLSSIKDSVIFDLDKRVRYADFSEYSYSSIIEDYYGVNAYSDFIVEEIKKIETSLEKDVLNEDETKQIKHIYDSVMSIPETKVQVVSPELRVKLKSMIIKNHSKLHGIL